MYLRSIPEKTLARVELYQHEINQQSFEHSDCVLLARQIADAQVIARRYADNLRQLSEQISSKPNYGYHETP